MYFLALFCLIKIVYKRHFKYEQPKKPTVSNKIFCSICDMKFREYWIFKIIRLMLAS